MVRKVDARRLPPLWCENRIRGNTPPFPAASGYHTSTGNTRLRAVSVACKLRSAMAGWGETDTDWIIPHGMPGLGLRVFLKEHMHRKLRGNMFSATISELCQVEACE